MIECIFANVKLTFSFAQNSLRQQYYISARIIRLYIYCYCTLWHKYQVSLFHNKTVWVCCVQKTFQGRCVFRNTRNFATPFKLVHRAYSVPLHATLYCRVNRYIMMCIMHLTWQHFKTFEQIIEILIYNLA